ncbi:phosphate starvation-inducible protein PhoH [Methylophaga sp. 41_12_T18]|nr:phosphate starvation-inducible protein PhoH [Methylophaga sp. 41_12_T18]
MTTTSPVLDNISFELSPIDNPRLANLCGHLDEHLRMMERSFGVEINNRGGKFQIIGKNEILAGVQDVIHELYAETAQTVLVAEQVHLAIRQMGGQEILAAVEQKEVVIKTKRGLVKARGKNQQDYLQRVMTHDINFGIGPAGTGKTYLAVACAVEALERDFARRIILVRPAVEAGERLGFLPGDLSQKVDPYLRPLYDALYEMLGFERVAKLIERNVIEVAPLAYMRGRTLNESFIILDEAQNTTTEQMKMFLTRLGYNSTAVITGDITQVDLPSSQKSGLRHVIDVLKDVEGIGFTFFQAKDIVRHALVQKVVLAYEKAESS